MGLAKITFGLHWQYNTRVGTDRRLGRGKEVCFTLEASGQVLGSHVLRCQSKSGAKRGQRPLACCRSQHTTHPMQETSQGTERVSRRLF